MYNIPNLLRETVRLIDSSLPQLNQMRYEVTWKADGSPVTTADVWLEMTLENFLKNKIPELNFIGEESYNNQDVSFGGWLAVLDPIDGTENFCSGLKEWGVSLSIWNKGKHAGSLLMLPELSEVMLSGDIPRIPGSRIVGFSSSYHPDISEGIQNNSESRIMGCAVYNLYNVIRGAFSRFINPKGAYSWDLLAGVSLAYEAGCIVRIDGQDYDGRFLEPNKRYCIDIQHRYDFHSR